MSYSERFEPVEVTYDKVVHQTDKAVLLEIEGDEFWVPLSTIQNDFEEDGFITVPYWLADEKGLV
jgi:hypothetical protein